MDNITIRKANLRDLQKIMELNNKLCEFESDNELDTYINDWSLSLVSRQYFEDLIENKFVVVAENKDSIIGYLAGSIYEDETYSYYEGITAELENMFVEKEYRASGVGSKLINSFTNWCKAQNAKRILVTATNGNDNAINFYKKHGFFDLNVTLRKEL